MKINPIFPLILSPPSPFDQNNIAMIHKFTHFNTLQESSASVLPWENISSWHTISFSLPTKSFYKEIYLICNVLQRFLTASTKKMFILST